MTLPYEKQIAANQMLETMRREFPEGCTAKQFSEWADLTEECVVDLAGILLGRGVVTLKVRETKQITSRGKYLVKVGGVLCVLCGILIGVFVTALVFLFL